MGNPFTAHPRAAGQTYLGHGLFALRDGAKMALGAMAATLHGVLPFLFETTGSRIARELCAAVDDRRTRATITRERGP